MDTLLGKSSTTEINKTITDINRAMGQEENSSIEERIVECFN